MVVRQSLGALVVGLAGLLGCGPTVAPSNDLERPWPGTFARWCGLPPLELSNDRTRLAASSIGDLQLRGDCLRETDRAGLAVVVNPYGTLDEADTQRVAANFSAVAADLATVISSGLLPRPVDQVVVACPWYRARRRSYRLAGSSFELDETFFDGQELVQPRHSFALLPSDEIVGEWVHALTAFQQLGTAWAAMNTDEKMDWEFVHSQRGVQDCLQAIPEDAPTAENQLENCKNAYRLSIDIATSLYAEGQAKGPAEVGQCEDTCAQLAQTCADGCASIDGCADACTVASASCLNGCEGRASPQDEQEPSDWLAK